MPFYPSKVLQARERASTPYSSVVFYLGPTFGSLKELRAHHMDWDKYLHTILFTYIITFKVGTSHTPFQLVYGLHVLMPIKYLLPMTNFATSQDFTMTQVFNIQLTKLEKLEKSRTLAIKTT